MTRLPGPCCVKTRFGASTSGSKSSSPACRSKVRRVNPRRARIAALLVVPALLVPLAACSSKSSSSPSSSPSGSASASSSASGALKTTSLTAEQVQVSGGSATSAPTVTFPVPSSASKLSTKDVKAGTGTAAKATDTVTVNYVGVGALTGKEFDQSYKRGEPATFPLNQVIPGWTQGIPGMKVGGERTLVIPGDLAYGPQAPQGSGIQPNETLVFVVQLVKIGGTAPQ